jgi:enoyl-CoA hydratase/carnithine racemase
VPAAQLSAAVADVCAALLAGGPRALAGTKQLLAGETGDADDRYGRLLELSARHFGSAEAREGAAAFRERRAPVWPQP